MLQILRNKAQSIVIQAIVVIIALVFIFWGVGTNMMNSREAAIVVNDHEITFQEFQTAYERSFNRIRDQFGGNVPSGLLEQMGIKEQVTNQLIQEALLLQGAQEMGIQVSREEIATAVEEMVQFQENGTFSIEKYQTLLSLNGYTPHSFEQSIQVDMLAQKASLGIGNFASEATDFEIEDLYRMEKSTVAVEYVEIKHDGFLDDVEVNDEELSKWYATVQNDYKTEPKVKLKYLDFSYSTVGQKITVEEDELKNYFDDNSAEFSIPEKRSARHILFKADESSPAEVHDEQRKKAEEILALAKQGEDFASLAEKYSEGPSKSNGGDLGQFGRGQMVKPFEDATFSLELNGISEVVKTAFGYHIIKVESIVPSETKPFSEVENTIREKLQNQQAKPLAFQLANEAYEGIIGAGSLDAYLKATQGTLLQETDFFSRSAPPEDIGQDQKFLTAAFNLKENELSSLVETDSGYAIIYADGIMAPEVPEMEKIRDVLTDDFIQDKAVELAKSSAETLLAKATEGSSLREAANGIGVEPQSAPAVAKGTTTSGLPASTVEMAFKLTQETPYPEEPVAEAESFYVLELKERNDPQDPLSEEDKERYRSAIIQIKQQQVISSWLQNQRQKAKIFLHNNL